MNIWLRATILEDHVKANLTEGRDGTGTCDSQREKQKQEINHPEQPLDMQNKRTTFKLHLLAYKAASS